MGRFDLRHEQRWRPHFSSLFLVLIDDLEGIKLRAKAGDVTVALTHLLVKRLHGSRLRGARGSLGRGWWCNRTGHPLAQPLSGEVHDEGSGGVSQDVAVMIQ